MDEHLDKQSMDQEPDKNPKDERKRINSIPLWLQGISENAAARREPEEDEWQKEQAFVANQETGPTSIDLTDSVPLEDITVEPELDVPEPPAEKEFPLPNWIEESEETVENEITSAISQNDLDEDVDEITEEVVLEQPKEPELAEPIEPEPFEALPLEELSAPTADQGFEEIQWETVEIESEDSAQDEILPESEEIPEWLREMIAADEKQKAADERRLKFQSDEPTRPVVISAKKEQQDFDSAPGMDQITETNQGGEEGRNFGDSNRTAVLPNASLSRLSEEPAPEDLSPIEAEETRGLETEEFVLHLERDYNADFDGSGFEPIQFDPPVLEEQPEDDHPDPVEQDIQPRETVEKENEFVLEDWGKPEPPIVEAEAAPPEQPLAEPEPVPERVDAAQDSIDEFPSSLVQARHILEQGDLNEALEIIKSYISHSQYLNEIKEWLLTANEKIERDKSGLWEALGDISSHQGDHPNALIAYAKAIEYLELSRKNHHEMG